MATARRITDAERAHILELHGEGHSRNDIARMTGISNDVVSRTVRAAGKTFDRAGEVAAATAARQADNRAKRAQLAADLLDDAQKLRKQLWLPTLVYNFGGKDNTYRQHVLKSAPVEVRRNAVVTAGITFDKLTRIVERESGGTESALGLLDHAAAAFAAAAGVLRDEGSTDAGSE